MAADITTLGIVVSSKDAQAALDAFSRALISVHQTAIKLTAKPIQLKTSLNAAASREFEKLNAQMEKGSRNAVKLGQDWSGAAKHFHVGKQSVDATRESINGMTAASNAAMPSLGKLSGIMAGWFSFSRSFSFAAAGVASFAELENSVYKFNVTFEGVSITAKSVADNLMNTYRLSKKSTLGMLSDTGNLLQGFGFSRAESLKMADAVAKLGIDLASFHGYAGGAAGAVQALNAGLVGNTESLRALGIVVNMESQQFKTLYDQFREGQGMTDTQAKAWAILQTAMIQGKNALGDYLRPGETLNQLMADNTEATERFRSAIGAGLEGSAKLVIKSMTGLMNLFTGLSTPTQNLITRTATLAAGFIAYKTTISTVSAAKAIHTRLLGMNSTATATNTAAVVGNTRARGTNAAAVGAGSLALAGNTKAATANALATAGSVGQVTAVAKSFSLMGSASTIATAGVTGITRAIPYVGWALLALDAGMYIFDRLGEGSQVAAEALQKEATKAREAGEALRGRNDEALNSFERLKTLATYEQLHADEVEEARSALENIRKVYPDVGITIDATTGKINIQADAFRNLNESIQKLNLSQAQKELSSINQQLAFNNRTANGWVDTVADFGAKNWCGVGGLGIGHLFKTADRQLNEAQNPEQAGIGRRFSNWAAKNWRNVGGLGLGYLFETNEEVVDANRNKNAPLLQRRAEIERQMNGTGGQEQSAGTGSAQHSDTNKGYRAAVQAFQDAEWNIDYNTAGSSGKVQMIEEKMAAIRQQIQGFEQRATAGETAPEGEADYKTQAVQKHTELLELERQRGAVLQQQKETQAAINDEFERYAKLSMSPAQQAAALLAKMESIKAEMQTLYAKAASGELAPVGQKSYEDQFREKQREYLQLSTDARSQQDDMKSSRDHTAEMIQNLGGQPYDPKQQLADIGKRAQEAMNRGDYNGVMSAAADFEKFRQQQKSADNTPHPIMDKSRWMTNTMQNGIDANSSKARMLEARSFVRPKDQDPTTQYLKSNNEEVKRISDFLINALSQYLQQSGDSMNQLSAALQQVEG